MSEKCEQCGNKTSSDGLDPCEGAMAEERSQGINLSITGTTHLLSCNCCEPCRKKCLESWNELNTENENNIIYE